MSFTSVEPAGQPQVAIASLGLAIVGLLHLPLLPRPAASPSPPSITGVLAAPGGTPPRRERTPATAGLIIGAATLFLAILFAAI